MWMSGIPEVMKTLQLIDFEALARQAIKKEEKIALKVVISSLIFKAFWFYF